MSKELKKAIVYGTLGFVFVLFTLVMPIIIAQNHKRDCINFGLQKNYTVSDIASICGRQ